MNYGGSIIVAHALAGTPTLASTPQPAPLLLVFTITGGVVLGALGSRLRARIERRRVGARSEPGRRSRVPA